MWPVRGGWRVSVDRLWLSGVGQLGSFDARVKKNRTRPSDVGGGSDGAVRRRR